MKKNKLQERMIAKPIIKGFYKGYEYRVVHNWSLLPIMQWWCGYVRLPEDHRFIKKLSKKIYYSWAKLEKAGKKIEKQTGIPFPKVPKVMKRQKDYHFNYDGVDIDCHGGLTFGQKIDKKSIKNYPQQFTPGWWIGWDYNHAGDYHEIDDIRDVPKGMQDAWNEWRKIQREIELKIYGWKGKSILPEDKNWTQEEVESEVKGVIEQLESAQAWWYPIVKAKRDISDWIYWKKFKYPILRKVLR